MFAARRSRIPRFAPPSADVSVPHPPDARLRLFATHRGPARRRRLLALIVFAVAALALLWPGFALIPALHPLVLGLPFPLAWVIAWTVVVLSVLAWLYHHDEA